MKYLKSFYYLLLLLTIASCDIINPEEALPSYIQVNEFQLTTNETSQGSDNHQITDVWAFVNGEALGVFELPATIPVLAAGMQNITLLAGIRENGLRSTPVIYPLYSRYEINLDLVPEAINLITPTIEYISNSIFVLLEDFENDNINLQGINNGIINRVTNPTQVLSGNGAGIISLLEVATEITTIPTFLDLPTSGGTPVYLEIDYRTNVELEVGLVGFNTSTATPMQATSYKVILCPITNWNKVYINFQKDLELSQLDGYKLAFRASTNDTGCGGTPASVPEILLDNVKLIRFQP